MAGMMRCSHLAPTPRILGLAIKVSDGVAAPLYQRPLLTSSAREPTIHPCSKHDSLDKFHTDLTPSDPSEFSPHVTP